MLLWQPMKVENQKRKIGVFPRPIYFAALLFANGLQYCNSDFKRFNKMNFSTLCTILVAFGPETSEFTTLTIAPFAVIWQKSAYHAKYLRISWTYLDLHVLYRFVRSISGDDYPSIRLAVTQGTLVWQPVKFQKCLPTSSGMTFILCFGIRQQIGGRKSAFKRFNGNNQATSLSKFGELPSNKLVVFTGKMRNFCRDSPAIRRRSSFVMLSFQNG